MKINYIIITIIVKNKKGECRWCENKLNHGWSQRLIDNIGYMFTSMDAAFSPAEYIKAMWKG